MKKKLLYISALISISLASCNMNELTSDIQDGTWKNEMNTTIGRAGATFTPRIPDDISDGTLSAEEKLKRQWETDQRSKAERGY